MSGTVTAASGGAGQANTTLKVYVFTGASFTQNGATGSNASGLTASLTPVGSGSLVAVGVFALSGSTYTPIAGTSLDFNQGDADGTQRITGHSTASPTQGSPTSYGVTSTGTAISTVVAEILGASLAIDASSPAAADAAATSVTSASFTPPASVVLAAVAQANGGAGVTTMTITDTLGLGLSWSEKIKVNMAGKGYNGIWLASDVPAPASGLILPGGGGGDRARRANKRWILGL